MSEAGFFGLPRMVNAARFKSGDKLLMQPNLSLADLSMRVYMYWRLADRRINWRQIWSHKLAPGFIPRWVIHPRRLNPLRWINYSLPNKFSIASFISSVNSANEIPRMFCYFAFIKLMWLYISVDLSLEIKHWCPWSLFNYSQTRYQAAERHQTSSG